MICKFSSTVLGLSLALLALIAEADETRRPLVLVSDFGTTERFVASMKGVALSVDPQLVVHDLTHHIEPYNIWQVSYVLDGTIAYWPKGSVFVSVVDPGVGTKRKSVVVETDAGHFIVTPDNGSLTLINDNHGIKQIREIDEKINRRPGTNDLHTFHGRDVYSYTGARLAAGVIDFAGVGPVLPKKVVRLDYTTPMVSENGVMIGSIVHVETPFGNVVTNIPTTLATSAGYSAKTNELVRVQIFRDQGEVFDERIPFSDSFGFVAEGKPLLYSDSLRMLGLAVNSASFAKQFDVDAGQRWSIRISP